jgi:hypothetical protein
MINMAHIIIFITVTSYAKDFTQEVCPVIGNIRSHKFFVKGCPNYLQMLEQNKKADNRKCFKTRQEAIQDGYQIAKNCKREVYNKKNN